MNLQKIDFNHYYLETIEYTDPKFAVMINPHYMQFFKCGHVYLAMTYGKGAAVVNFAVSTGKRPDMTWPGVLEKECIKAGFEKIVFITSVDNIPVQTIANRWQCKLIKTEKDYYGEGLDALVFEKLINNA